MGRNQEIKKPISNTGFTRAKVLILNAIAIAQLLQVDAKSGESTPPEIETPIRPFTFHHLREPLCGPLPSFLPSPLLQKIILTRGSRYDAPMSHPEAGVDLSALASMF